MSDNDSDAGMHTGNNPSPEISVSTLHLFIDPTSGNRTDEYDNLDGDQKRQVRALLRQTYAAQLAQITNLQQQLANTTNAAANISTEANRHIRETTVELENQRAVAEGARREAERIAGDAQAAIDRERMTAQQRVDEARQALNYAQNLAAQYQQQQPPPPPQPQQFMGNSFQVGPKELFKILSDRATTYDGSRDAAKLRAHCESITLLLSPVQHLPWATQFIMLHSYLTGAAKLWIQTKTIHNPHTLMTEPHPSILSLSSYIIELRREFLPEDSQQRARSRLLTLKQTLSARDYISKFRECELQIDNLGDQERKSAFLEGLKPEVRMQLRLQSNYANLTFAELTSAAEYCDDVLFDERKKNKGLPGNPAKNNNNDPKPGKTGKPGKPNNNKQSKRKKLTPEQRQAIIDKNGCLWCRDTTGNHQVPTCPTCPTPVKENFADRAKKQQQGNSTGKQ